MTELAASTLKEARRIVVKVGSSLVAGGAVFRHDGLAGDLVRRSQEIVLISSGAVALGEGAAPQVSRKTLAERQALSAIGQPLLMAKWEGAMAGADARTAQILLTPDVTDDPERRENARRTIEAVLAAGLLPVVNENDTVATEQLCYGDNDGLAAQTAKLVQADLLILLTNVDGYFDADPSVTASAAHWPLIPAEVLKDPSAHVPEDKSALGTGGMRSKMEAAHLAAASGIPVIIAAGGGRRPLTALQKVSTRCSMALPSQLAAG